MTRNDQRRRRVVIDEALQLYESDQELGGVVERRLDETASAEESLPGEQTGYSKRARRRHQMRTTDLIPKRWTAVAGLAIILLASMALLNLGDWLANSLPANLSDRLRIGQAGSVSAWFSSVLFILSGLASLQIYALRQHRQNDYLGTYRVWLLFALLLLAGSLNCIVAGDELASSWLPAIGLGAGSIVWLLVIKLAGLLAVFIRGAIEVRASRATLALVSVVWLVYTAVTVLQFPLVRESQWVEQQPEALWGNLPILAHVGLFVTLVWFARHVFLVANGLISERAIPVATPPAKVVESQQSTRGSSSKKKARRNLATAESDLETAATVPEPSEAEPVLAADTGPDANAGSDAATPTLTIGRGTLSSRSERTSGPLAGKLKQASNSPAPSSAAAKGATHSTPESSDADDDEETESLRGLSKAERKKLRKAQSRRAA